MIHLVSFGICKRKQPVADVVIDVRAFSSYNPYRMFKGRTGREREVQAWFMQKKRNRVEVAKWAEKIAQLAVERGDVLVAAYCSWGHHRSVAFIELLAAALSEEPVSVSHWELKDERPGK